MFMQLEKMIEMSLLFLNESDNEIAVELIEEDSYKFQNACWRSINLKPFKCNGHGIYVF